MLRTNLSTRPFYNERAVQLVFGLIALLVVAVSVYNVSRAVTLTGRQRALSSEAARDEARARQFTEQATASRRTLNPAELAAVASAAQEANTIIDARTFSWTELFNRIEGTLPADVMLLSVKPKIDAGEIEIQMIVIGRRVEDIDAFMEKLEQTGAFVNVLSRAEETTDEGTIKATLASQYRPNNLRPAAAGPAGRPR
jgi:hypothetical protein